MTTITRFEEIRAWQTARTLTRAIYQASNAGAFARDFGLRDQLRRASVSIMSNIAEGFESAGSRQFVKYLGYAKASAGEVRAQLYVALDADYLTPTQFKQLFDLADHCSRQLSNFITYLNTHPQSTREPPTPYEVEGEQRLNVGTLERSNVPTFKRPNVPTLLTSLKSALTQCYGDDLRHLILYGSYARAETDAESDVDILIVLAHVADYWEEVKRTSHIIADLSLRYDVTISPVRVSEVAWLHDDSPFLNHVRQEGVAL
jgi:four helix bundle protein